MPGGVELLLLGGRPINEPVAMYGPFVMNTRSELQQAFAAYQAGLLGVVPTDHLPHGAVESSGPGREFRVLTLRDRTRSNRAEGERDHHRGGEHVEGHVEPLAAHGQHTDRPVAE